MSDTTLSRTGAAPVVLSLLRFFAGLAYMQHGLTKFIGFPHAAPPHLGPLLVIAAIIETFGGFLVCIGLFSRPAAFIMSGEMAIAYFMVHAPRSFFPYLNGGEPAMLYCFIFLYIAVAGGGALSVDRLLSGPRSWLAGPAAA